tara:strand:+ start:159 stop:332 length:174 start_codon:yes stop_codon:yes gene_type:complete
MNVKYDVDWEIEQIEGAIFYYIDAAGYFPKNKNIKKNLKSLYSSLSELKRDKRKKLD